MKIDTKLLGILMTTALLVVACGKDQDHASAKGAKTPDAAKKSGQSKQTQAEDSLSAAGSAVDQAKAAGAQVADAQTSLRDANDAYKKKVYDKAILLATQAQQIASQAYNQMQLDKAKALILVAQKSRDSLSGDAQVLLRDAETAYDNGQGELAMQAISSLMSNGKIASQSGKVERYVVMVGDSLWIISGKPEVYNDPYQWPLIFKANTDRIKDPDLVIPGWKLTIKHDYSQTEIREAIRHARHRGPWMLGKMTESDMRYLGMIVEDHKVAGDTSKGNVPQAEHTEKPKITPSPRVINREITPAAPSSGKNGDLPPPIAPLEHIN